jgi:hypothetical protein
LENAPLDWGVFFCGFWWLYFSTGLLRAKLHRAESLWSKPHAETTNQPRCRQNHQSDRPRLAKSKCQALVNRIRSITILLLPTARRYLLAISGRVGSHSGATRIPGLERLYCDRSIPVSHRKTTASDRSKNLCLSLRTTATKTSCGFLFTEEEARASEI